MNATELTISKGDLHKLLCAGNADAALLYLYIQGGNAPESAQEALRMSHTRYSCAMANLRQLGLWSDRPKSLVMGERPAYTETDVLSAMDQDRDFRAIYGEIQRQLGRSLNTEEMKIILGFIRYLGLPVDVISVLVCYCQDRARRKGGLRNPSLRTIEKEAYAWVNREILTLEQAEEYISFSRQRREDSMKPSPCFWNGSSSPEKLSAGGVAVSGMLSACSRRTAYSRASSSALSQRVRSPSFTSSG